MITNSKLEAAMKKGMSLIRNSRSNCSLTAKKKMSGRLQVMRILMIKVLEEHVRTPGFCQVDEQGECFVCTMFDELNDMKV